MKILARGAVLFLVAVLCGCAASTDAVLQSLQYAVRRDSSVARAQLNPNLRYLRVTVAGRVALLVLGEEERHPLGPIEVWFSAEKEVLRFQNGRLAGAAGLTVEWRSVSLEELPAWSALARANAPIRWVRVRDVMPGYRFGVRDPLVLRITAPPRSSALQGLDPERLTWFEEEIDSEAASGSSAVEGGLRPARYAVEFRDGEETVVYGEQCLAPELCFTWQRWPAAAHNAKAGR